MHKRMQSSSWPEVFSKLTEMQRILLAKKMRSVFRVEHLTFWFIKRKYSIFLLENGLLFKHSYNFLLSSCKDKNLATLKPVFIIYNLKNSSTYQKYFHNFFSCIIQSCSSHYFEFLQLLQLYNSSSTKELRERMKDTVPWELGRGPRPDSHMPCLPSTAWNQTKPSAGLEE